MRNPVRVFGAILAALAAVIVALVLVLVVGGSDGNGNGDNIGATSTATPTTSGEATPAPDGEGGEQIILPPKEQGELRIFGPDPLTLDPALASDAGSARYIVEVFSGLVTLDKDTLQPVPDIAESIPEPVFNDDDTVSYTFNIRRGVLFHDFSRQVTATDFKFSLERSLAPQTLSTVALVYLGDIVGARDFSRGNADEVTGIKVIDDFTLEITIDAPKPLLHGQAHLPHGLHRQAGAG